MLTKKGKYGLKALIALARLPEGRTAVSGEIALANQIPKKFLDTILLELRKAGIVRARKGPNGGYCLSRPADEIRVGHAIRVIDGPLAPIRCASRQAYQSCEDCADPARCLVRKSMTEVRDAMADILDGMTLGHLVSGHYAQSDAGALPAGSVDPAEHAGL